MGEAIPFQEHFQSMATLGCTFKVGDVYDYRHDRILTGKLSVHFLNDLPKYFVGYDLISNFP